MLKFWRFLFVSKEIFFLVTIIVVYSGNNNIGVTFPKNSLPILISSIFKAQGFKGLFGGNLFYHWIRLVNIYFSFMYECNKFVISAFNTGTLMKFDFPSFSSKIHLKSVIYGENQLIFL